VERRQVSSGSPYEPIVGFCRAVRVGDRVVVAGTAPIWPDGSCDGDAAVQARRCLEIIRDALGQVDARLEDVIRTRVYLVDGADFDAVGAVHGEHFGSIRPANTTVIVAGLLDPRWRVEIEAEAVVSPPHG
jgi:enamine deaminase RidA (YjgF/YER057c/UK114 family)